MGKHCEWTSLQYASTALILCGRPGDGWHVRWWCRLREDENAGEASLYLEIDWICCVNSDGPLKRFGRSKNWNILGRSISKKGLQPCFEKNNWFFLKKWSSK